MLVSSRCPSSTPNLEQKNSHLFRLNICRFTTKHGINLLCTPFTPGAFAIPIELDYLAVYIHIPQRLLTNRARRQCARDAEYTKQRRLPPHASICVHQEPTRNNLVCFHCLFKLLHYTLCNEVVECRHQRARSASSTNQSQSTATLARAGIQETPA